jgi:ribulose-phosphate 3-epimerase
MNACTFHPEIVDNSICEQAFQILKTHGVKYGIALKTNIDANQYINLLKACDYVSVMSVVPGKGGQSFMPEVMDNLKKVKKIKTELNPRLIIQLDGGVNFDVMRLTKEFVDHYVIGSFLMKQTNKKVVFDFLKNL